MSKSGGRKHFHHHRRDRNAQHADLAQAASPQLLAFGYTCKLFRDDAKAAFIDQGRHLIPWMGEDSLLIDRFDVRGYLQEQELKKYESNYNNDENNYLEQMTEEEQELYERCQIERYRNLPSEEEQQRQLESIESEFQTRQADEGLTSSHQLPNSDTQQGNAIGFDYSIIEQQPSAFVSNNSATSQETPVEEENDFILPKGLEISPKMVCPRSMRMHCLIEKTAFFIARQGMQMEIILKTKQSSNPQFNFLHYDSELNAYYKHLVNCIKDHRYSPEPPEEEQNERKSTAQAEEKEDERDDSDDDHYLHPSLFSGRKLDTPAAFPSIPRLPSENSAYSQLVKSLKDRVASEPAVISGREVRYIKVQNDLEDDNQTAADRPASKHDDHKSVGKNNQVEGNNISDQLPPLDIQAIIDKLAQYVSKNGEAFEHSVHSRNEARFNFLNSNHVYHQYYLKRKLFYLNAKVSAQTEKLITQNVDADKGDERKKCVDREQEDDASKFKVPPKTDQTDHSKLNKSNGLKLKQQKDDSLLKEKQEERRRKAALFLSLLKNSKKESDDASADDSLTNKQLSNEDNTSNKCSTIQDIQTEKEDVKKIELSSKPILEPTTEAKLISTVPFISSDAEIATLITGSISFSKKSNHQKNFRISSRRSRSSSKSSKERSPPSVATTASSVKDLSHTRSPSRSRRSRSPYDDRRHKRHDKSSRSQSRDTYSTTKSRTKSRSPSCSKKSPSSSRQRHCESSVKRKRRTSSSPSPSHARSRRSRSRSRRSRSRSRRSRSRSRRSRSHSKSYKISRNRSRNRSRSRRSRHRSKNRQRSRS